MKSSNDSSGSKSTRDADILAGHVFGPFLQINLGAQASLQAEYGDSNGRHLDRDKGFHQELSNVRRCCSFRHLIRKQYCYSRGVAISIIFSPCIMNSFFDLFLLVVFLPAESSHRFDTTNPHRSAVESSY